MQKVCGVTDSEREKQSKHAVREAYSTGRRRAQTAVHMKGQSKSQLFRKVCFTLHLAYFINQALTKAAPCLYFNIQEPRFLVFIVHVLP